MAAILALYVLCTGCHRAEKPESVFERARQSFISGDLAQSQHEAQEGYRRFGATDPEWGWKFKVLEGRALLWRSRYAEVLHLFDPANLRSLTPDTKISILTLRGVARGRGLDLEGAAEELGQAKDLCSTTHAASCSEAFQGLGVFALEQNLFSVAQQDFDEALRYAQESGDRFLETSALLNKSALLLKEGHFDEAIDSAQAAWEDAKYLRAWDLAMPAEQNLAWAFYRLGDSERALDLLLSAKQRASQLGDVYGQQNALTDIGYIQMDAHRFDAAQSSFLGALDLAAPDSHEEPVYNALRALALLKVQNDDLDGASDAAERALEIAHKIKTPLNELYPILVQGKIAARRGNLAEAEQKFRMVEQDPMTPAFLKWEARHSLALLYEQNRSTTLADKEYRAALETLESTRSGVQHPDFQLSFLTNGARIYDDYVHFLIANAKPDEALLWADHSRARALAEGLGLFPKGKPADPATLNVAKIAQRTDATILFYWLGEQTSYLWAITARQTRLFRLPSSTEIENEVERHNQSLSGPQDLLDAGSDRDFALYRMLVAPAADMVSASGKVIIIPDGKLNNLNFETLVVPGSQVHFWIDDVRLANASSLRLIAAPHREKPTGRNLLMLGSTISPGNEFPELRNASVEIHNVEKHFQTSQQRILSGDQATPAAYLGGSPEQFAYIHFVTHAVANRSSPLDSAVILSRNKDQNDSFKLYARDIIHHPVRANLVTISSCYSAGTRAYSGEGLVGLSWAFVRAGAHNVVAALWDASDLSTSQLMDKFYEELSAGNEPDVALRSAKLSLLHSRSPFRKPFYWGPFQLYIGS
jgi:CHAT domain-containing protein